ncbi:hypothetical protein ES703_08672 [subsurface metagenome]
MLQPGWFYDENGSLMHKDDVGVPNPGEGPRARSITRTPITRSTKSPVTSTFRRIGNSQGFWGDITSWWAELKTEYKWGIGALGGLAVVGIVVAATRGDESKGSTVKKI